jgi:hypothetical protein
MCGKRWNSKRSELLVRCKSQEKAQVAINAKHFTEVEVKKDILSPVADAGRAGRERESQSEVWVEDLQEEGKVMMGGQWNTEY